ncbi:hypothetical protein B0H14DRAFT_201541 [Mycena olivaceomarginata]|nr:hypothetical protein B0H14DRAFT_201541 [Mycena olivaceomarginata]
MRIRISSRVRLGTRAALPDREYRACPVPFLHLRIRRLRAGYGHPRRAHPSVCPSLLPPRRTVVYDMHHDHPHCPPPAPASYSSTTLNAMCSATTRPLPACFTCLVLTPSPPTPCYAHALNTRSPRTSDTPLSRRCRSSTRAVLGCSDNLQRGVTDLSVLGARLRAPQLGCTTPPRPMRFLAFRRSSNHHMHHYPHAQRSRCSLSLVAVFFVAGLALRRLMRRPRFPGLLSTQEHPPTYPPPCAHTGGQTRSATGMRSARRRPRLTHQEAIVAYPRLPSAAQLPARPPCGTSRRLSPASSIFASLERGVRHPP